MSGTALLAGERFRIVEFVRLAGRHQVQEWLGAQLESQVVTALAHGDLVGQRCVDGLFHDVETIRFLEEYSILGIHLHLDQVDLGATCYK